MDIPIENRFGVIELERKLIFGGGGGGGGGGQITDKLYHIIREFVYNFWFGFMVLNTIFSLNIN